VPEGRATCCSRKVVCTSARGPSIGPGNEQTLGLILLHAAAGSFRNRSADFLWMLLFGGALLTVMAPLASIEFLGSSLTFMMVYVWGRRHPYVTLSFLGIFTFTAPYLPWVLLGFSLMLGSSPKVDLLGMVAGGLRGRGEGTGVDVDFRAPVAQTDLCRTYHSAGGGGGCGVGRGGRVD
jgi:hypothetical protein